MREVAQQVQRARDKTGECAAAVRQAGELARDALELLGGACRGAVALEDRAAQVVRQWAAVVEGAGRLARRLADLDARLQELLNRLLGDRDAHSSTASPSRQAMPVPDLSGTETQRVARQRRELPDYITSGRYEDETGQPVLVQSGKGPESPQIARHLFEAGILRRPGMPFVAMHVEPKVAWRMRTSGRATVELVINNKVCQGDLSCRKLVEDILCEGQTLVVHDPTEDRPLVFKGRSPR
ncbi:DddA-like double-stranded DNA deaminase toxin [Saccharothrix xinjiangensis]|uniref:DddA-like double-stranded DNA deaminase toxin n=1 Tax=Saccharothrix xinjiangensis TaxID=204798 RepID=A0ABV9Y1M6_9PSEU